MKEKTDHKATRRGFYAPDTAVAAAVVSRVTSKTIPMNKYLIEDGSTRWRGACFADSNAEMGIFARMQFLENHYD